MDEQAAAKTVQRHPVQAEETWPKKRTLLIGARPGVDFIRAYKLLDQLPEDFKKYEKPMGRHHGIAYGGPKDVTIYAWRTKTQVILYFDHHGESQHGKEQK